MLCRKFGERERERERVRVSVCVRERGERERECGRRLHADCSRQALLYYSFTFYYCFTTALLVADQREWGAPTSSGMLQAARAAVTGSRLTPRMAGSIRQHASAYVSIRQNTSGYVRIRQDTSASVRSLKLLVYAALSY